MIYKVTLDHKALAKKLKDKLEPVLDAALNALGEMAKDNINRLSSEHLRIETHKEFIESLKTTRQKHEITISISDPRMAALEEGYPSFDMKPGMLKSKSAKKSAGGGMYMNVPMQHRTMEQQGRGTYIAPQTMREAVAKAQESLKAGESMTMFPSSKEEPTSIHSDMRVTAEKAQTFRRVSTNSPAEDWIHPGHDGIKAFEATVKAVEDQAEQTILSIAKGKK